MAHDVVMTGEAPGSLQTRDGGPDVSKPVPVPDGASGTPQAAAKGNGAAGEVGPKRRRGGRAKGSPKVPGSGRRKGAPNALGKDARQWLAANSNYLEVIARTCAGKAIRMAGPTGKQVWRYPDWADRRWAIELVARKLIPDVTASEISGPDGAPLVEPTRCDELYSTTEAARRIAFILAKATQD